MLRIFRTLGINEVDATHFKKLIDTAPAHQRQSVMALLAKLKALIKARERSMQKRRILENDQEELYKLAEIRISEHVEADVVVRIGGVSIGIAETLPGAVFRQVEGKIETRDLDDLPGELA